MYISWFASAAKSAERDPAYPVAIWFGADGPNVIENFTRVTTFGEYQNHWVSATIETLMTPTCSPCISRS